MRGPLLAKRSEDIRGMFGRIAATYDPLNRLLSLGQDLRWRGRLVARATAARPDLVLDVCTGTGDLALSFAEPISALGCDFSLPMLERARRKAGRRRRRLRIFAGDALRLPLVDAAVDVVTVAFGVRNFENLTAGLTELARVLRPGGTLLMLEFSRPRGALAPLLGWWVRRVPPSLGRLLAGDPHAYGYLSDSVASFPDGPAMAELLGGAGFASIELERMTGGVATLYRAVRRAPESRTAEET